MSPSGDLGAAPFDADRVPVAVAGLALVLAGVLLAAPVSIALARARWTSRAPGWCLLLWQAVCLAAGSSVVAGLVLMAVEPSGHTLIEATAGWWVSLPSGAPSSPWRVVCGLAALSVTAVLLLSLIRTAWRTVTRRRLHRRMLDLLSRPMPPPLPVGVGCQVRVMDHRSAVAYTLPGLHSRLVVSTGLLDLLTPAEVAAVVEHERAHLRARHDILIMPFQSWVAAFGRIRGVREAGRSVGELTEMLADDVAAGRCSPDTLASALTRVALERSSAARGEPGAWPAEGSGTCITDRVRRLNHPAPLPVAGRVLIVMAAAALLAIPAATLTLTW